MIEETNEIKRVLYMIYDPRDFDNNKGPKRYNKDDIFGLLNDIFFEKYQHQNLNNSKILIKHKSSENIENSILNSFGL